MRALVILCLLCLCISCGNKDKSLDMYLKGKEAYSKKELKSAAGYFTRALDYDSSFLNARLMLSKIYYFEKNFSETLNQLDKILSKDSDHMGALYWKARTLVMEGAEDPRNEDEAIQCLQKVLEIDSHHIRARSLLALLYEKRNKYKEALYEYTRILEEQEVLITSRANLGILYKRIGLRDKSLKELNHAVEMAKIAGIKYSNLLTIIQEIEK